MGYQTQEARRCGRAFLHEAYIVMGIEARAVMPGDALLFRGLSHSTIGADWFHVRVREGIGWVTDAMVTKQ